MATNYKMPALEVGDIVQYRQTEGAKPCVAICVDRSEDVACFALFQPGYSGVDFLDGVRHKSDSNKHAIAASGFGTWEHRPTTRWSPTELDDLKLYFDAALKAYKTAHDEAAAEVKSLRTMVEQLEARVESPSKKKAA